MSIPAIQKARIGAYIMRNLLAGHRWFPLNLTLEPLFRCNLRCNGCGKTAYPEEILSRRLSVEECVSAAEECGAPVVSIAGGEPLLHPDIPSVVREITARKRFVYLCTNALLVEKQLGEFSPSPYLAFNLHLDGMRERHDSLVCCQGVFDKAVSVIHLLVSRGFRVTTNTTFFEGETPESAARFFDFLTSLGVEGMTVSSGFRYESAADQGNFLGRDGTKELFRRIFEIGRGRNWKFHHSPLYLEFLAGNEKYTCLPWANPTRNIFGWQSPCYLLSDGYAATYMELLETTDWERYGTGKDPRCADCMVHGGFEPSAVMDSVRHPLKAFLSHVRGVDSGRR